MLLLQGLLHDQPGTEPADRLNSGRRPRRRRNNIWELAAQPLARGSARQHGRVDFQVDAEGTAESSAPFMGRDHFAATLRYATVGLTRFVSSPDPSDATLADSLPDGTSTILPAAA